MLVHYRITEVVLRKCSNLYNQYKDMVCVVDTTKENSSIFWGVGYNWMLAKGYIEEVEQDTCLGGE